MTITNRGAAALATGTGTSVTPADPSLAASDIIFIEVAHHTTNPATDTFDISANGTGWTKLGQRRAGTTDLIAALYIARKSAIAGMPTITVTGSSSGEGIYARAYAAQDDDPYAGEFWEAFGSSDVDVGGGNSTLPSITTTGANRFLFGCHALNDNETPGAPTNGWTSIFVSGSGVGSNALLAAERIAAPTAGLVAGSSRTNSRAAVQFAVAVFSAADAPSGGGVTGTLAATEAGSDGLAGSGSVDISGSVAGTEIGSDTVAGNGDVAVAGPLAATETGADSFGASGTVTEPGLTASLAAQEAGADTAVGSGVVEVSGALGATEQGGDAFAAAGSVTDADSIAGALAAAEAGLDAFAGSGSAAVSGAVDAEEARSDTATGSGSLDVVGSLSAAEAGQDSFAGTATAEQPTEGVLVAAEAGQETLAATGQVDVAGTLSVVETGSDTFSGVAFDVRPRFRTVYRGFRQSAAIDRRNISSGPSRLNRQPSYVRRM